jgi:superfamily I DNA and/or RNA helicase
VKIDSVDVEEKPILKAKLYGKWSWNRISEDWKSHFSGGQKIDQEIKGLIFQRSKVSIIFANFFQEVKSFVFQLLIAWWKLCLQIFIGDQKCKKHYFWFLISLKML